jgi:transglutaminase-like putative cysteine protease
MAAQRSSSLVCIARTGLTVAVALGLTTVFADRAWLGAALFAAIAPHVLIAWSDRPNVRPWVAVALVIGAAFLFTLYAVEPHTTRHGLPTSDTFDTYFSDLRGAAHTLRTAVVPVPAVGSALALALVTLWTAGAIAEWSARRLGTTLGAIAPSLVLFVAIAALGEGGWTGMSIVYSLAVACYLVALHQSEMRERRSWFHAGEARPSRLLEGGVLAGIAIVLAAAVVAPLVPGSKSGPWFDYRSLGKGGGGGLLKATSPIVGIKAKLLQDPEHEVFTVDIDDARPVYWRVIALDKYDGNLWTLEDTGEPARRLARPAELANAEELKQTFRISGSDAHWLPAAYYPIAINLEHALAVPDSATLYLKSNEPLIDLKYEVTSAVPVFTDEQKQTARAGTGPVFDRYLELPPHFAAEVRNLAADVTASSTSAWTRADALARYLNSTGGFTYDDQVARSHSIKTLEDFLFRTKRGYCEQFASAFAAMARSIGLPTRIAVGYSYGTPQDGEWHVKNKDAHAWPEVYFAGLGWVPFEPTPGRGANGPDGSGDPTERPAETAATPPPGQTTTPTTAAPEQAPGAAAPFRDPGGDVTVGEQAPSAARETSPVWQFFVALGFLGIVAVFLAVAALALLVVAVSRRTWRRRHAPAARDRILGAWAQALEHLAEAGVEPKPSATPLEFALRYAPAHGAGAAGPALMDLAVLQTAALFAPDAPSSEDARRAWEHVDAIDRAIERVTSRVVRWRRRLDPRRLRTDDVVPAYA